MMPTFLMPAVSAWVRSVTLDAQRLARVTTTRWPQCHEAGEPRQQDVTSRDLFTPTPRLVRSTVE